MYAWFWHFTSATHRFANRISYLILSYPKWIWLQKQQYWSSQIEWIQIHWDAGFPTMRQQWCCCLWQCHIQTHVQNKNHNGTISILTEWTRRLTLPDEVDSTSKRASSCWISQHVFFLLCFPPYVRNVRKYDMQHLHVLSSQVPKEWIRSVWSYDISHLDILSWKQKQGSYRMSTTDTAEILTLSLSSFSSSSSLPFSPQGANQPSA